MKFTVYLLLIGACALVAEATPISETASPEVEDAEVENAEVEVGPKFVDESEIDSKELPVECSPFFTCGDHNCTEMELLESIMLALNDFSPYLEHQPDCVFAQPPPKPEQVCADCADSQVMIMKVAGLLRSLADLLSLCGAPELSCPHGAEPKFSESPCPEAQPSPEAQPCHEPSDPDFGHAEVEVFDKALDAMVAAIMERIHEEVESEEECAEEEVFEEIKEEEAEEAAEEEAAKEEEKSEEVVKKDLEVMPEEVETLNPEVESETAPRKPHKKKKKKSKEPAIEVVAEEGPEQSSMMDGLMDVFNLSQ